MKIWDIIYWIPKTNKQYVPFDPLTKINQFFLSSH